MVSIVDPNWSQHRFWDAGEPAWWRTFPVSIAVYPRVCGGTGSSLDFLSAPGGLSPTPVLARYSGCHGVTCLLHINRCVVHSSSATWPNISPPLTPEGDSLRFLGSGAAGVGVRAGFVITVPRGVGSSERHLLPLKEEFPGHKDGRDQTREDLIFNAPHGTLGNLAPQAFALGASAGVQ